VCHCHPLGDIKMHTVETLKGGGLYYLANNPRKEDEKALLDHLSTCPRHHVDDPDVPKSFRAGTEPGVIRGLNKKGEETIDLSVELFPARSRTKKSLFSTREEEGPEVHQLKNPGTVEKSGGTSRSETAFGGVLREWYLYGLDHAKRHWASNPTLEQVVEGMWRVMLDDRIKINKVSLSDQAWVPFHKITRFRQGEQRLLVGLIRELPQWEDEQTAQLMLHGVDVDWPVVVGPGQARARHGWKRRLCLVAAEYRDGRWHALRKPAVALLHPDGAVWLDSMLEWRMYEFLRSRNVQIEKPLRECPEWYDFKPDFVLPQESPPVVIEVWGLPDTVLAYHERKENKRNVYREHGETQGKLRFLEWDAQHRNDWERFVKSFDAVVSAKAASVFRYAIRTPRPQRGGAQEVLVESDSLDAFETQRRMRALMAVFGVQCRDELESTWPSAMDLANLLVRFFDYQKVEGKTTQPSTMIDLGDVWNEYFSVDPEIPLSQEMKNALGALVDRYKQEAAQHRNDGEPVVQESIETTATPSEEQPLKLSNPEVTM